MSVIVDVLMLALAASVTLVTVIRSVIQCRRNVALYDAEIQQCRSRLSRPDPWRAAIVSSDRPVPKGPPPPAPTPTK